MELSRASSHALHAVVHLAGAGDRLMSTRVIAQAQAIPEAYLFKVLLPLVHAGVLVSAKGPNGGYRLARPAGKVTVLEVLEAIDGPVRGTAPHAARVGDPALQDRLQDLCERMATQTKRQL